MKRKISILTKNAVKIGNISFDNPIWVASGTFGYGTENPELVDVDKLGAIVTKSITLYPREGNPPPRIVETASGMINSIGLANIGVDKYIKEMLPIYDNVSTKIIMNIAGTDINEYVEIIEKVESVSSSIAGYEINISCPNVKKGGMEFGVDAAMTEELTAELRKRTNRLLIMKLSPNVTSISEIALAAIGQTFPIYFIIIATSIGVTVAGTSLIGNSIGENNKKKVYKYIFFVSIYAVNIYIKNLDNKVPKEVDIDELNLWNCRYNNFASF